jgi:hypothetical protein
MSDTSHSEPMRVLFLCTHNSSRSQMAEGLLHAYGGDRYAVFSAGTHPRGVHPIAIQVMREIGIDISEAAGYRAKSLEAFLGQPAMRPPKSVLSSPARDVRSIGVSPTQAPRQATRPSGWRLSARCETGLQNASRCLSPRPRAASESLISSYPWNRPSYREGAQEVTGREVDLTLQHYPVMMAGWQRMAKTCAARWLVPIRQAYRGGVGAL